MKLPFVSRKQYDAITARMAETIAELEDHLRRAEHKENMELRALREALFHRGRAEALEKTILERMAVTPPRPVLMPAGSFAESHNATPAQHENATDAEKHNETDS
jgi:hypothetical protein